MVIQTSAAGTPSSAARDNGTSCTSIATFVTG